MASALPSFWQRTHHQLCCEMRRERWLLLFWLLLLTMMAFDGRDSRGIYAIGTMPAIVPVLAGLALIVRLVRADHPGSSDTAALTRPIGRGALWLGKAALLLLAGLLPWCLANASLWLGYGLSPTQWLGVAASVMLPALTMAGVAAWLASWRGGKPATFTLVAILGVVLLLPVLAKSTPYFAELLLHGPMQVMEGAPAAWFGPSGQGLCRSVTGISLLAALAWLAWWRHTMGDGKRRLSVLLCAGILVSSGVIAMWHWNWLALPAQAYAGASPKLVVGDKPSGRSDALWPGVYLTGLPPGHAAAVVAFAPVRSHEKNWPQLTSYSDYPNLEKSDGRRWMTVSFDREVAAAFPSTAFCIGDRARPHLNLKQIVLSETKRGPVPEGAPWRLRLAIYSIDRVHEAPLREMLKPHARVSPAPGWKLDFDNEDPLPPDPRWTQIMLNTLLWRRQPLIAPSSRFAPLHPRNQEPWPNFFVTVYSPSLDELTLMHEQSIWVQKQSHSWRIEEQRSEGIIIPLPVIHQQIEGLNYADWIEDCRLAVWWPEERGTVDLELSAEEMRQAMAASASPQAGS